MNAQSDRRKTAASGRSRWIARILWLCFSFLAFLGMVVIGSLGGYWTGQTQLKTVEATMAAGEILDQYSLASQDLQAGRYDLARQRLEYILARDPSFPGVADKLAEAMQVLFATATPTQVPPTVTLTPTPDLRPIEELFNHATQLYSQADWNAVVDMLVALRQVDPQYRVVDVDSLLYRALRNRGLAKINAGSLEEGIYDLALVERFGPLDREAVGYRDLARYYVTGSGFWEVYPAQAVYYFGLVASAAPYMKDASGWTAFERYRVSLMHYGDQYAREGNWCEAQVQYDLAVAARPDPAFEATAAYAAIQCSPPTETPAPYSPTPSDTGTPTATATFSIFPSDTPEVTQAPTSSPTTGVLPTISPTTGATPTSTPTFVPSPTANQVPTDTPTATAVPQPSATPTPSQAPPPPDTPTPTATPPDGTTLVISR